MKKNTSLHYDHLLIQTPYNKPELFMMHSHNTYELLYFEKGEATYVIENRKYRLHKNDLVFIRPLKYHYIEITSNSEYARYNVTFAPSFLEGNTDISIPNALEVVNCPQNGILSELFKRMDYYRSAFNETAFYNLLPSLLTELLYNLSLSVDNAKNAPFQTSTFLTEALEYINDNLFTIKTIKEVSEHFFVSEQYFFKQFQTQLKITPKKYINDKRLLHAQQMIQQGKKPIEVFEQCGFESYAGFYKQYVKTFGRSPSKEKQTQTI